MFQAIHKETGKVVTIYGTHCFPPKQFHHGGYIGFLIYENGHFTYAHSANYEPIA